MVIDWGFLAILALFGLGPVITVITATQWCKMEKNGEKKRRLPCLSTKPKPDTRIECPNDDCRLVAHRRVIRTYTQPGVAVHRYYKCKCGQPIRQSDYFSDKI